MIQDFRFQDGKQLPVKIIADDSKEHCGNDEPLPSGWAIDPIHNTNIRIKV
jgi:hypothetical protein